MVASDITIRFIINGTRTFAEHVPNTASAANLIWRTFDLVGGGCYAPQEVFRERHLGKKYGATPRLMGVL